MPHGACFTKGGQKLFGQCPYRGSTFQKGATLTQIWCRFLRCCCCIGWMRSCWFGYSRQRLGLQCLWQCRDCLHRRASLHLGVDLSTQFLPLVPDPFEGALLPKLRCINSLLGPYWITSSADAVQLWYHLRINTTSKIYVLPARRDTKLYIVKLKDRSKSILEVTGTNDSLTLLLLCKQGLINCGLSFW